MGRFDATNHTSAGHRRLRFPVDMPIRARRRHTGTGNMINGDEQQQPKKPVWQRPWVIGVTALVLGVGIGTAGHSSSDQPNDPAAFSRAEESTSSAAPSSQALRAVPVTPSPAPVAVATTPPPAPAPAPAPAP